MQVYRIAKEKYIKDLTGIGAKTVGGRWNQKGTAVLYTSSSAALSALEVLVHLPAAYFPDHMSLATIEIPDNEIITLDVKELPKNWNKIPPPAELQLITKLWIEKNDSLGLKIPSIVIPKEKNIILNPLHPQFHQVKIIEIEAFDFDTRLL